jgi:hypothetical protein
LRARFWQRYSLSFNLRFAPQLAQWILKNNLEIDPALWHPRIAGGCLLYFGFSSHIQHGLACLIAFLLVRWISLFLLAHKIKA